jgi:hypothetical protein
LDDYKVIQFSIKKSLDHSKVLTKISIEENKSISYLSKEPIAEALELQEDPALYAIAEKRDSKKTKRVSHENAWK